jgi:chromosome segregation ATPase
MFSYFRASLAAESSRSAVLEREKLAAVSQLETEVKGLQRLLKSVTFDLEEAQSRLAEYQEADGSLERSAHTISSLHQELRASKEKEAELEKALRELTQSQSDMGQRQGRTHMQHQATLASLQEALELERATKDEMVARLSEVQGQLEESEEARGADAAERRRLRQRLEECERELERGRRAEEARGEKEAELGRMQALLQSLEVDNREQVVLIAST